MMVCSSLHVRKYKNAPAKTLAVQKRCCDQTIDHSIHTIASDEHWLIVCFVSFKPLENSIDASTDCISKWIKLVVPINLPDIALTTAVESMPLLSVPSLIGFVLSRPGLRLA